MSHDSDGSVEIAREAKYYFSAGTLVASIVLPATAGATWAFVQSVGFNRAPSRWWLWVICLVYSYAAAYFIPEPSGYEDAGRLRLTRVEAVVGFGLSFVLYFTVLGADCFMRTMAAGSSSP